MNAHGNPVTLRGMSLFWSHWMPRFFNLGTLRWLRDDWRVDVVRHPMAIEHGGYLDSPAAELRKLDIVVQASVDLGLYVIIDWHCHHPMEKAAIEFFSEIATRYGALPNVIFETWNEPEGRYEWDRDIKPYHETVVGAIRARGSRNLVILGTPFWSQRVAVAALDPVLLPNVAYALHFYASSHKEPIREQARIALELGACLFASEWGTGDHTGGGIFDPVESRCWLDFLETNGISHLNWSISDKEETCAALRPGASADGGWSESDLTRSGLFARTHLRGRRSESG
jgi:endoglucanase